MFGNNSENRYAGIPRRSGSLLGATARPVGVWPGTLLGTIVIAALAVLAAALGLGWQPRATFAAPDVTPELITGTGNKTCADDLEGPGQEWTELKVDPNVDGQHTDGTLTVNITHTTPDKVFTWSSNIGVDAVFVKAGTAEGSYLYRYDPPSESTGDDGLTSPGEGNAISHIAFCYDVEPTPTPTATPTATLTATPTTVPTPTAAAATQAPSPTPAVLAAVQLPATGGDAGSGSGPSWPVIVLAALALLAVPVVGLRLRRSHKR